VALFSGGHDSATATLIANESGADTTLHINTGIGVEQTRDYVRATCSNRNWNLREYKATENTKADGTPDPQIYEDIVREHGFPGAPQHYAMYVQLKERQLARFERDIRATPVRPVLYISGARSDESVRRMGNVKPEPQKKGRQVWLNAIHDFTKKDCSTCMAHCALHRNEVVDLIHKSGECLCGAFAEPGELSELEIWFPKEAKRIRDLEQELLPKFPWGWEDHPPAWYKEKNQGQMFMLGYDEFQPLCHRCNINAVTR
jgi:3'-phosphoadenosine 5'-phosphosulfate sulfotransferase (PAPS reductase)/FAD synthetase